MSILHPELAVPPQGRVAHARPRLSRIDQLALVLYLLGTTLAVAVGQWLITGVLLAAIALRVAMVHWMRGQETAQHHPR